MRRYLVNILFITIALSGYSQSDSKKYDLQGQVVDNLGEELPYVSIGIFKSSDSSYVAGIASGLNGKFKVAVPNGNYYAQISFLSFKTRVISNINVSGANVNLKRISMEPDVADLDEFSVVEEKKLMEIDLDKRVFNVDKDVTNQGADATEILDNVPSVSVDVNGNVSLRGSQNVRILIDGKPSGMVGMSSGDALKMLQGNQIEKIEVITNPSSRYEAEGEVGIINIVLKKDNRDGINGSVNVNAGYPGQFGGGFNITLRKKKFSIFTGYGANYRESPGSASSTQNFTYPDTVFSYTSESEMSRSSFNNNFNLGAEYYLNEFNTLTVSGNVGFGGGKNGIDLTYRDFNDLDVITQEVVRIEDEDKERYNHDINLSYRKTFKQKDRVFSMNAHTSDRVDNENSTISQANNVIASDNLEQRVFNNENGQNYMFQSDYVHPIGDGKFETGVRYQVKKIDDDYAVEQFNDTTGLWDYIPGFVNYVKYQENVAAAYVMFGNKVKKFSYQLGVRAEHTDLTTDLVSTNQVNQRDYMNFFPTTHLSYELKNDNTFQVSYSRRIQRPRHWWLLPFFNFSDNRSNFSGNPNLNPEFTDSYELGYLKNWEKGSLLSSFYYRYTTNSITRITTTTATGITQRFPINLGTKDAYGIEFSGSYELLKWWDLRGSFNFYREIQEGEYLDVRYGSDAYVWSTRLNSKWKIKKVNLQASFNYRAPQQSPQGETLALYSLDSGMSFDLLKGNGTIALNVRDLFNSRRRRSVAFGENFVSESEMQWRARSFRVSFTYRINQKKKRERNGGGYDNFDGMEG